MYMNFWYPVVRSEDLGPTPQKVRILAHDFVVFRDEQGKPAVLSDTCVHRGASLSGGFIRPQLFKAHIGVRENKVRAAVGEP